MSRAFAKIVKIDVAQDRYDRPYFGASIELIEPASGSAFIPIHERLRPAFWRDFVGKTAIIENYDPGAPILFIVGILDETPASLIEKLTAEAKAAVESSKPDAQKSDLEVVKAMLTRAGIAFKESAVDMDDARLDIEHDGHTTWVYFSSSDNRLVEILAGRTS